MREDVLSCYSNVTEQLDVIERLNTFNKPVNKELPDEQLNAEICKWWGWTEISDTPGYWRGISPHGMLLPLPNHIYGPEALNNIHKVENRLSDDEYGVFVNHLKSMYLEITKGLTWHGALSAPARQRAIALLHVVKPELFSNL